MRIAVINEVSASQRNADILEALGGFGHQIHNVGMESPEQDPSLTYIHTGLMSAMLLNLKAVDFVIGGCGTGQGYLNAVMQYPGVACGLVSDPLDGWLFSQINGGNCISLALNKGYGWAGNINLRYIFEKLFQDEMGAGYPEARSESQKKSRETLKQISSATHYPMIEIIERIDPKLLEVTLAMPEFRKLVIDNTQELTLKNAILKIGTGL